MFDPSIEPIRSEDSVQSYNNLGYFSYDESKYEHISKIDATMNQEKKSKINFDTIVRSRAVISTLSPRSPFFLYSCFK